jgi:asparagine synthase (glutamine-hydrolysing)
MCGIFVTWRQASDGSKRDVLAAVFKAVQRLEARGPIDVCTHVWQSGGMCAGIGFTRQRIVDQTLAGSQPSHDPRLTVVFNGEIYNYEALGGTSEIDAIKRVYLTHGAAGISRLNGVFAIVIFDAKKEVVVVARDVFGVRPLFIAAVDGGMTVASTASACQSKSRQFDPATICTFSQHGKCESIELIPWAPPVMPADSAFAKAVSMRVLHTREAKCAFLLSGGLDSTCVVSHVRKMHPHIDIITVCAGMQGSPDLKAARQVARALRTHHYEAIFTPKEALRAVPAIICALESPCRTTVRASVPMYFACKLLASIGVTSILSGEGADELMGGYLYFHDAPTAEAWHDECMRRLHELHKYDVLRADRVPAMFGIDVQFPFLDTAFTSAFMEIALDARRHPSIEKLWLRRVLSKLAAVPESIVWRVKEGMSDGGGDLRTLLQEHAAALGLSEREWYEAVLRGHGLEDFCGIVDWMPTWTVADDPSGKLLRKSDVHEAVHC